MKNLAKAIILLASSTALAGCVEDGMYYNTYPDSGYYSSYEGEMTSGYNRDYHHRRHRNRTYTTSSYSVGNSGYSSSQTPANNGYYSSGSGYSSSYAPARRSDSGYSSSASGYSSSASSSGYQSSGSQPQGHYNNGGHGLFGKALKKAYQNQKAPQVQAQAPAPANNGGWSSSVQPSPAPSSDSGYSSSANDGAAQSSSASGFSSGYSSSN